MVDNVRDGFANAPPDAADLDMAGMFPIRTCGDCFKDRQAIARLRGTLEVFQ